jgi:RNA polymerase sigma-70 factor (ECF subfamily)
MSSENTTKMVQDCLDLLKMGDEKARARLIEHCHDRLRGMVRAQLRRFPKVREWEETTDVYHNVFFRLDRALKSVTFATARDFFQLAAQHVRFELIDLARRHTRHPELLPAVPDRGMLAEDAADMETWERIHTLITDAPEEERVLFDLLYYHELTQNEAAALLDEPLSTIKKRWQKARIRLIGRLGGAAPF